MKFYRMRDIDLDKVQIIPRLDLDVDGSFTAFDLVGNIDTTGLLAAVFSRFTIFKLPHGVIRLRIKCKYNPSGKRCQTVETYGVCTQEESELLDAIYRNAADASPDEISGGEVGGSYYDKIYCMCHPFASPTVQI